MREIKFRAWLEPEKKMNNGLFGLRSDGEVSFQSNNPEFNVILMQYTGLKDKNGKEIYEGDIVVKKEYMWFSDGAPNYRGTVEWIFSQWQVVAHCINPARRGISDGVNEGLNDDGIEDDES